MGSYIGLVKIGSETHALGSTLFGTSTSAADAAAKVATLSGFNDLATGVTVHVQFANANTVTSNVTLKVGSTDAKPISNPNGALTWAAGSIISFTYDGTNYVINSVGFDANSITIDASQLNIPGFGNITKTGHLSVNSETQANTIVVTDSNGLITSGAAFQNSIGGMFLDRTGNWSAPADTKYDLIVGATANATADAAVTSGNSIYLNLLEDGTKKHSHNITSDGLIKIASNASGDISLSIINAAAKTFLAGPTSGNAAAPTFRAIADGDIPNTIARLASPAFSGTPTAPTVSNVSDSSTNIATTAFVAAAINAKLASNDAMLFKGTIGTGGTPGTLPTTGYEAGWTYRVIHAGTYAGQECEVGDLLIAITDYVAATASNADWTVAQTNIDGSVYMGNNSLASGQLLVADGNNGKIKSSGYVISAPSAIGDLLYASSTTAYNVLSVPSTSSSGKVLTLASDGTNIIPTWSDAQHYNTHLYVNATAAGAASNAAVTSGSTYIHLYDTSTKRETIQLTGSGGTTITASNAGVITIKSKEYQNGTTANAFTSLELGYYTTAAQTESTSANTAYQIGYVDSGILYIKSIKYNTTSVITGISEKTNNS